MALFDFLNLNNPAAAEVGQASKDIYEGFLKGSQLADQQYRVDLENRKLGTDELIRNERLPFQIASENLGTVQKLNFLPGEPTDDDRVTAVLQLNGGKQFKSQKDYDSFMEKRRGDVDKLAMEFARDREPVLDPFNPMSWVREKTVEGQPISDVQGDILKAREASNAAWDKNVFTQKASTERAVIEGTIRAQIAAESDRRQREMQTKQIRSTEGIAYSAQTQAEKQRKRAEANDLLQNLTKDFVGKYNGPRERKQIIQRIQAIENIGDDSVTSAAHNAFANELKLEGYGPAKIAQAVPGYGPAKVISRDPQIEKWAKQYGKSYDDAKSILTKRGYVAK